MVQALHATGHSGELVELLGKDHFMASSDIGVNDDPSTLAIHKFPEHRIGEKRNQSLLAVLHGVAFASTAPAIRRTRPDELTLAAVPDVPRCSLN